MPLLFNTRVLDGQHPYLISTYGICIRHLNYGDEIGKGIFVNFVSHPLPYIVEVVGVKANQDGWEIVGPMMDWITTTHPDCQWSMDIPQLFAPKYNGSLHVAFSDVSAATEFALLWV